MVFIYLDGHDFEYDIFELIRVFFFGEEIVSIDDLEDYPRSGILIESYLLKENNTYSALTKVTKDGDFIGENKIKEIEKTDIKQETLRKKLKVGVKQSIYEMLDEFCKANVPWGILTGVRPIKLVHDLIEKGYDNNTILNIFEKEYKLSKEKATLILDIANKQKKYIYPINKDSFSLYVSIPFCPTRCIYCSFPSNSIERVRKYVDLYTEKLIYEIKNVAEMMENKKINTVYIGGGTPTAIPVKNLERIIESIYFYFGRKNIQEITVEAGRPDTINRKMLNMLKQKGIDRISINPQTMNDRTLKLIGRKHNSKDIVAAFNLAREIGFSVINMDIIVGLPGEGVEEIKYTLNRLIELEPENLTVHTLAVKKGSKFKQTMNKYEVEDENIIEDMLDISKIYAEKMKLEPYYLYRQKQMLGNYENIGYALKGMECIYNILII